MVEFTSKSAAAYTQLAKTTLQLAHVSELLRLFQQAGLPLILLKGSALLERVYPAAEQRPMQDIDVLVRQADFERAAALLQAQGYEFSSETSVWNEAFARELIGETPYRQGTMVVDLHWHLTALSWFRAATAFDLDGLWARAVPAEIALFSIDKNSPFADSENLCYNESSPTHKFSNMPHRSGSFFVNSVSPLLFSARCVLQCERRMLWMVWL